MGYRGIGHMGNGGTGGNEVPRVWGHMGNGNIGIIMHRSRWGTWVMGHMGNGVHG